MPGIVHDGRGEKFMFVIPAEAGITLLAASGFQLPLE